MATIDSLTYLDDLSRVRIVLTDLNPSATYTLERSVDEQEWIVVRGGQALSGLPTRFLDDYEFTSDVENFYRIVPSFQGGMVLPGDDAASHAVSTDGGHNVTGSIRLRAEATLDSWNDGLQVLVSNYDASTDQRGYALLMNDQFLRMNWSVDGIVVSGFNSTVPLPANFGDHLAVEARLIISVDSYSLSFFYASNRNGPWIQLGDTITNMVATSIFETNANLLVGAWGGGTGAAVAGMIHWAEVYDIGEDDILANPDFSDQEPGTTQFTDDSGREWSLVGDAEIVGGDEDSITPEVGRVWLKSINYPFLNMPLECVDVREDVINISNSGSFHVIGRSRNTAVHDVHSDDDFILNVTTETITERDNLKFAGMAGGTFLLSVPPESDDPECAVWSMLTSGYVSLGDVGRGKRVRGSRVLEWFIPCVVVNRPGNGVIPTTITWTGVERTYDTWNELLAENATWLDLLDRVIHPSNVLIR